MTDLDVDGIFSTPTTNKKWRFLMQKAFYTAKLYTDTTSIKIPRVFKTQGKLTDLDVDGIFSIPKAYQDTSSG